MDFCQHPAGHSWGAPEEESCRPAHVSPSPCQFPQGWERRHGAEILSTTQTWTHSFLHHSLIHSFTTY